MSASVAAAGAAAIAYYAYSRSRRELGRRGVIETHTSVEQAPNDWTGELFLFAEGLRYLYFETLARWPTADLFIGLVYLARQGLKDFPAKQVVAHGKRKVLRHLCGAEASAAKEELLVLKRLLLYSQNLKFSKPVLLQEVWAELELKPEDFLIYQPKAAVLKPAYVLVKDDKLKSVVLAVRGTHSVKDIFTSLTGACKPHHLVSSDGVVLGHSHFGMLAGARWILKETAPTIESALRANPGYTLRITGHSMGGGAAAMLTMIIRAQYPSFGAAHCTAFACPGCMTLEIAKSCSDCVTTVVFGTDVVPSLSPAALDLLREDVAQSSWANAFRKDVRSSNVVQAVEGRVRGWMASVSSLATTGLKGCYGGTRKGTAEKKGSEMEALLEPEPMGGGAGGGGGCCGGGDNACKEIPVLDYSDPKNCPLPVSNNVGYWEEDQLVRELVEATQEITIERTEGEGAGPSPSTNVKRNPQNSLNRSSSFRERISKFGSALGGSTQPRVNAFAQWSKQTSFTVAQGAGSLWSQMWFRKQKLKIQGSDNEEDDTSNDPPPPPTPESSILMEAADVQEALENEEVEGVFDGRSACNRDDIDDKEIEAQIGEGSLPQEVLWKRQLYPAGRILHFVPAFILNADHSMSPESSDCEAGGEENEELVGREGSSGGWCHPKELDLDDDGVAIDENEKYVLFTDVPQEAYNRVRMSRSMVGDHFVPRYRGAIESLIEYLDETRERES